MSATVAAILKKVGVAIASNKKARQKIGILILEIDFPALPEVRMVGRDRSRPHLMVPVRIINLVPAGQFPDQKERRLDLSVLLHDHHVAADEHKVRLYMVHRSKKVMEITPEPVVVVKVRKKR